MYEQEERAADGPDSTTRRMLLAVAAAGAGLALSGCSVYGEGSSPAPATGTGDGATTAGDDAGSGTGSRSGGAVSGGGAAIAQVSEVPVGGGMILADRGVVLTQPSAGTIRAFSAVCTHAGCTVSDISGGRITCPCHGSAFNLADGSVAKGPAGRPLSSVGVTVDGDAIRLG